MSIWFWLFIALLVVYAAEAVSHVRSRRDALRYRWLRTLRYRWLRKYSNSHLPEEEMLSEEALDQRIDEILAGKLIAQPILDKPLEEYVQQFQPMPEFQPMPGPQPLFGIAVVPNHSIRHDEARGEVK